MAIPEKLTEEIIFRRITLDDGEPGEAMELEREIIRRYNGYPLGLELAEKIQGLSELSLITIPYEIIDLARQIIEANRNQKMAKIDINKIKVGDRVKLMPLNHVGYKSGLEKARVLIVDKKDADSPLLVCPNCDKKVCRQRTARVCIKSRWIALESVIAHYPKSKGKE